MCAPIPPCWIGPARTSPAGNSSRDGAGHEIWMFGPQSSRGRWKASCRRWWRARKRGIACARARHSAALSPRLAGWRFFGRFTGVNRGSLEHLLRAAGGIGASMEADIVALDAPDLTDLVEGAIGERSMFHETFGYYAQAVGLDTAILPDGWDERLKSIQSPASSAVGPALDPADLAVAKLAAGREKDRPFVAALFAYRFADPAVVRARIQEVPAARLMAYGPTVSVLEGGLVRIMSSVQNHGRNGGP